MGWKTAWCATLCCVGPPTVRARAKSRTTRSLCHPHPHPQECKAPRPHGAADASFCDVVIGPVARFTYIIASLGRITEEDQMRARSEHD
jgi:hypothetical protein